MKHDCPFCGRRFENYKQLGIHIEKDQCWEEHTTL